MNRSILNFHWTPSRISSGVKIGVSGLQMLTGPECPQGVSVFTKSGFDSSNTTWFKQGKECCKYSLLSPSYKVNGFLNPFKI